MGCGGSKHNAINTPVRKTMLVDSDTVSMDMDDLPTGTNYVSDAEGLISDLYQLGAVLGRGGFSVVVEATSKADGEKYAAKIIEKNVVSEDLNLLRREIEIMRRVDHPGVLKCYDVFEDDERVYIIMELVRGSELFDRIVDKGNYTEKESVNLIRQVLDAVSYLHHNGIAHRDLKPENLLCSGTGKNEIIKIADFGLSKIFSGEEVLKTSCGTPGYVAPEVLLSDSYDKSVDLWSVGVITYIILSGYSPFYAEEDALMFELIMNAEYDFDDETWDHVSDTAKDFIEKLLVGDPKKRMDAEQSLAHPWLNGDVSDQDLGIEKKMKEFNEYRKQKLIDIQEQDAGLMAIHLSEARSRLALSSSSL